MSQRAQSAASARATALCDEVDRRRHELMELRGELDGVIAVCSALLKDGCESSDLEALARAKRIRDQITG